MQFTGIYTGIGSRKTPPNILKLMTAIGFKLGISGWTLRSGGAIKADTAFEIGTNKAKSPKEIYTTENFIKSKENYDFCYKKLIPILDKNRDFSKFRTETKLLLLRNVHQIYGQDENAPLTKFVIFWIPTLDIWDENAGGTKYAVRMSEREGIPLFNLYDTNIYQRLSNWINN